MVCALWQRVELVPNTKTGEPTEAVVVTVCVLVLGPLQPSALAVTIDTPDHEGSKVTSPVAALIVLPPARLAASRLYVIPVVLVAVAL
jgi:hypothetical protein